MTREQFIETKDYGPEIDLSAEREFRDQVLEAGLGDHLVAIHHLAEVWGQRKAADWFRWLRRRLVGTGPHAVVQRAATTRTVGCRESVTTILARRGLDAEEVSVACRIAEPYANRVAIEIVTAFLESLRDIPGSEALRIYFRMETGLSRDQMAAVAGKSRQAIMKQVRLLRRLLGPVPFATLATTTPHP